MSSGIVAPVNYSSLLIPGQVQDPRDPFEMTIKPVTVIMRPLVLVVTRPRRTLTVGAWSPLVLPHRPIPVTLLPGLGRIFVPSSRANR